MTNKEEMDGLFGELRSHLNHENIYDVLDDLVELVDKAATLSSEIYEKEWMPYIQTFTIETSFPEISLESVERFQRLATLLPHVMFDLELTYGNMKSNALVEFATLPHLSSISSLKLGSNDLNAASIKALMGAQELTKLHTLQLDSSRIGDDGVIHIAQAPNMASLRRLVLSYSRIGDRAIEAITTSKHLASLNELYMDENNITAKGAQLIADAPQMSALTDLDLSYNSIGDAGAQAIANSPHLSLSQLGLNSCDLTTAGKRAVKYSSIMSNQYGLEMNYNDD